MKAIIFILILLPSSLYAATIFEPSLSVGRGSFSGDISGVSLSGVEANYTTLSAGLRYGITREYIHVTAVADAYYVNLDSSDIESEMTFQGNLGIGLGYEWNIPLRTYVIIGVPTSSIEVSYYFSESMILGLRYNRMSVEVGNPGSSATADVNINAFGLTVSFPFEFDYPGYWWRKKAWE